MKLALILFLLAGCIADLSKDTELKTFQVKKEDFNYLVNSSAPSPTPNLSLVKKVVNDDYPIELSIYENGQFYYMLENLGDGFGTWEFKDGKLALFAERDLFDMHIDILAIEEKAQKIVIQFRDRHGLKTLSALPHNLP